jgi:hypothetical protein
MYTNEVLEEIWAIKDRLWREAEGDLDKFFEQLQEFARSTPHQGPVLRTNEEVRRFLDFGELPTASVHEDETPYGAKDP